MKLFRHKNRQQSAHSRAIYARFELAYTAVDFGAALSFVIGSILFFYEELQTAGTWCFLIGSILFAAKPSLRLAREIKLYSLGDTEDLAERLKS